VSEAPTTKSRRFSFGKTRLEAFSDGVYAIAITLLILDVAVVPGGSPWDEVLSAWPSYIGYVVSFLTIGVSWIGHTAMTDELDRVDAVFLRLNLLLLLVVVFLPFPTTLITDAFGDREAERVAATVYGGTLLLIRLLSMALDRYARRERLYNDSRPDEELDQSRRKDVYGVAFYILAIIGGFILPGLAVTAYFAITLYLVIPFSEIARIRLRRRASTSA
jgi:uncharacterized membrane protein